MDSTIVATKEQVSCELSGEAVILHMKSGMYYGLNAVGARIWSLLQNPRALAEIRDTILQEFEVEPDRCERDLLALLDDLSQHALIEVSHPATA